MTAGLTGAVIFAKDMARVARFYQQVCGLQHGGGEKTHIALHAGASLLVVHAIPRSIAKGIVITQPPQRREDSVIKPVFGVSSLKAARALAPALGGELNSAKQECTFERLGSARTICDGHDPEGNVFQLWQADLSAAAMPASRQRISSGSRFEAEMAYSRAVVAGDWVFVSGTTGFDYATMTIDSDVVEQARQCLRNIEHALSQADSSLADVVRVQYLLPDSQDFEPCWPVLRAAFGEVRPAATMIQAGLADPRMRIEIEVTALKHHV